MGKSFNQLKAGVVLSYISMFINAIISVLYTPIMLRLLGKNEFGLYQLVYSAVSYLGLLSFGFGSAYMRFYSRYKAKEDSDGIARLNGMFMTVFLLIAVITIVVGVLFVINTEVIFKGGLTGEEIRTAKILISFMVFNIAVSFPASVFHANITAHEQYFFQRIVHLLRSVCNPFLSLPLLLLGFKSVSLVLVTTLLTVISLIVNAWFCIHKLNIRFSFKRFDFSLMKEIFGFSFFIFLNMITDQINWSADKIILGSLIGTASVAVYSIGAQLNSYYMTFSSAISTVFIPRVNRIIAETDDNQQLTRLFIRVGRLQFLVLSYILSALIIFGRIFISFWAGPGYNESYAVALLLVIPVTIPCIQSIGVEIQRAKNMHLFRSVTYIFIAIANILISIPLVKSFGVTGAAIGTMLSLVVGNGLLMNWYYNKHIKLNIRQFWSSILSMIPAALFPTLFGIIGCRFISIESIWSFLICGVVFTVIFSISMWIFALNDYEKTEILKPIHKIVNLIKSRKSS